MPDAVSGPDEPAQAPRNGRRPEQKKDTILSTNSNDLVEPDLEAEGTFADLGVIPQICEALSRVGFDHPFPIQELAIPIALTGADMIGQARTGTGKTLAFGISILQRIRVQGDSDYDTLRHPGKPQALVMCPTRELAMQVARDIAVASTVRQVRVLTVYGGVGYEPQLEALTTGVDVVVGTPGRLLDLARRRDLDLSHAEIVVLDEADEMLDLGFLPDVERLMSMANPERPTLLFSATMPSAIISLARANLRQPVHVRAEGHDAQATVPDTTQFTYQAHDLDKPEIVGRILQSSDIEKTMIFTRTKRAAQRLSDELENRGFSATSIHGDLSQVAREKALKKFREGKILVLVATDVAARGIDVSGVSHVINYECPDDAKAYVHRIGRTGRAGAKGVAVTLVDWADVVRWKVINKVLGLDAEDLVETYSTSGHLFDDLAIPAGTRGYLPGHSMREREAERGREAKDGDHGHGKKGHGDRSRETRADKGERPKQRRRTRNGQSVSEQSPSTSDIPAPAEPTLAATPDAESPAPRRRRRRRTNGQSPNQAD